MSAARSFILYACMVPVFFLIDLIWLGIVAKNMYNRYLGHLLSPRVNWIAAVVFYLLFIFGILFFAVLPALEKKSLFRAVVLGALFGGICYATYDLTNLATVKDWPLAISFIDICWGIVLTGSVSTAGYIIGKTFLT